MREIIHVHLGNCGSQIGLKYWGSISEEHCLDPTGTYTGDSDIQIQGIDVSFKEITDNKYVPRAIFSDTDPNSSDLILQSSLGKLFKPEYMVKGQEGSGSNFARALYTDGAEVSEGMMELIRQEAEKCETLQGFQVTHALGGGTGSGFSYKLFDSIRSDIAVSTVIQDYVVFPAEKICDSAVEIYNVVLALPELYFNPEIVHVLDNEALYDIASRNLVSRSPNNDDINEIIGAAMAGVTSSFRFPGQINSSMKKFASNLTYFYRMHFYMTEYAPLAYGLKYRKNLCSLELIKQLFDGHNVLCSISPNGGKYFTAAINFRGNISAGEAEDELAKVRKQTGRFMDWIPDNFHASYCDVAPVGFETAATLVSNSSAIAEIFKEIKRRYTPLYKRKAYLHWFTCEGMDEMEFRDAEGKLDDCIIEHGQWSEERGNYGHEYDSDYVY